MGRRSAVVGLPKVVLDGLNKALVAGNFSGYEALSEALKAQGYTLSKSALHRYGQTFEAKLGKLKLASEQAQAIAVETGDDKGAMNDVLIRLVQERMFNVLMMMDEPDEDGNARPDLDPKFVRALAQLANASVRQNQWAAEVREKVDAKLTKLEGEQGGAVDKLDLLRRVREEIYGLVK